MIRAGSLLLLISGHQSAAPEALEIEAFLASHAHAGASEGGLYQGDLPHLWKALQHVDRWLNDDRSSYTPERRQEITEQWRQAFTAWEKVINDAVQYLSSMNQSAQQAINRTYYLSYKNIVVHYIQILFSLSHFIPHQFANKIFV